MSKIFESLTRAPGSLPGIDWMALTAGESRPQPDGNTSTADLNRTAGARDLWELARKVPLRVEPGGPLLPFDGTNRYASEQYRILRTRVAQHPLQPRAMVVSSAGPRDGKSTTAINLAAAFALKSEAKILLIDGDFRRSSIAAQLGLPEAPGLSEVLKGDCPVEDALLQAKQIPNLFIFPAGRAAVNASELLDSPRWLSMFAQCRQSFQYVVVDSPPMRTVADFDLIQASCDGVILVARQDHTKRAACLQAVQSIPKQKLIGVVLNSITSWPFNRVATYGSYYNT